MGSIEEGSVFWGVTNFNYFGASQELHDEAGGDNGRDTQLHQRAWGQGRQNTAHISLGKQHIIKKMNEQNLTGTPYTELVCFSLLAAFNLESNPQISTIPV